MGTYSENLRMARALGRAIALRAAYAAVDDATVQRSLRAALDLGASIATESGNVRGLGCASAEIEPAYRATAARSGLDSRTTQAVWLGWRIASGDRLPETARHLHAATRA